MKKIIRCIIISFMLFSHASVSAEDMVMSSLKTSKLYYGKAEYQKVLHSSENAIQALIENSSNFDSLAVAELYFYKGAAEYNLHNFDASMRSYDKGIQYFPNSTVALNAQFDYLKNINFSNFEIPLYWAELVLSRNSKPTEVIHHSCTTFILVMFFIIAFVITLIVVRRIKSNTLKLF